MLLVGNGPRIALPAPSVQHQWEKNPTFKPLNEVLIDTSISKKLKPHQIEGVFFLYQCLVGSSRHQNGCILADEMGLGKTLQCLTLISTLLKSGPYAGKALLSKIIIVTPGSLVNNWKREFRKWLNNRMSQIVFVSKDFPVSDFSKYSHCHTIVLSYEMFLRHHGHLSTGKQFDLMICDEAQRLKNSSSKLYTAIKSFERTFKVLLTGTPIQNNINEFCTLLDLVNPQIMTKFTAKHGPLNQDATDFNEKLVHLQTSIAPVMLRRTCAVLQNILPTKTEYLIVLEMDPALKNFMSQLSHAMQQKYKRDEAPNAKNALAILSIVRKLSNHFSALDSADKSSFLDATGLAISDFNHESAKLKAMKRILSYYKDDQEDQKIIIVSNFTKTLNIIESVCSSLDVEYLRFDGGTKMADRLKVVDEFNDKSSGKNILLLSNKAGGTGLNLVSASSMIFFDIDWNPANDLQAIGRIWRQGQLNDVKIYRLTIAGSIEEKIIHRQFLKQGISTETLEIKDDDESEEFQDLSLDYESLFQYNESESYLHDVINCPCSGSFDGIVNNLLQHSEGPAEHIADFFWDVTDYGFIVPGQKHAGKAQGIAEINKWSHYSQSNLSKCDDKVVGSVADLSSFIYESI